jgi:4,5:9,10-diseco-3-hydroxy-5,9,17-trioxoandrosta-1(10),2-diene-4-oate hydrolase
MTIKLPQDKYIKVGNINTRYWQAGDKGSAVVLVHGLGGFCENWMHNIEPLAKGHRVYAMDLVGFGRSDKTPLVKDMDTLVQFISDFMDAKKIVTAALVGNSLGGGLVLQFALRFPQKVEKLVLTDNAGMGRDVIADFKICALPFLGEMLIKPSLNGTEKLWHKIVYDPALVTPDLVKICYELGSLPGAMESLLSVLRAGINICGQRSKLTKLLLKDLNNISVPTLIFWGRQDRIIPVKHASIAAAAIPTAKLTVFDSCGHMPMFEYPEGFNKLTLEFLAK